MQVVLSSAVDYISEYLKVFQRWFSLWMYAMTSKVFETCESSDCIATQGSLSFKSASCVVVRRLFHPSSFANVVTDINYVCFCKHSFFLKSTRCQKNWLMTESWYSYVTPHCTLANCKTKHWIKGHKLFNHVFGRTRFWRWDPRMHLQAVSADAPFPLTHKVRLAILQL